MKAFLNKALVAIALLSISGSAFGYRWGFTNVTNKTLVIKVTLNGTDAEFFNVVQPGRRTEFDWGWGNARAGFCLSNIIIGAYNPNIAVNFPGTQSGQLPKDSRDAKFLDDSAITRAIDSRSPWFYELKRQPLRQPKVNFIKGEAWGDFDKEIKKAADKLASGVASTAEQAATAAGYPIGDLISKNIGGVVTSIIDLAAIGKCMSREFDVIEKDGSIELFTKQ